MTKQNYQNHYRFFFGFHFLLLPISVLGLIGACINLYKSIYTENLYSSSLIALLFFCVIIGAFCARIFALKAQDRAIRAEENLRLYVLTGKLHNPALRISQIIALRFASENEIVELSAKAVKENLRSAKIKKMIKNWKPDHHRV